MVVRIDDRNAGLECLFPVSQPIIVVRQWEILIV